MAEAGRADMSLEAFLAWESGQELREIHGELFEA
ncbi:hypothetical protein QO011_001226 [Labrys wisconsinensis]|uniref:Uncharacterized protein n=1 Tax=Labrys wisconsinensis TaxID=425677 RepID=A0ABU0J1U9_9HYPH|nr:hypothetical protein [Labrys wisconsinensis]